MLKAWEKIFSQWWLLGQRKSINMQSGATLKEEYAVINCITNLALRANKNY